MGSGTKTPPVKVGMGMQEVDPTDEVEIELDVLGWVVDVPLAAALELSVPTENNMIAISRIDRILLMGESPFFVIDMVFVDSIIIS